MTASTWAFLSLIMLAAASAGTSAAAYRNGRLRLALVLWTLVVVAISVPFSHLTLHSHWAKVIWVPFGPPFKPFDIVANVALYVPWGFLWSVNRSGAPTRPRAAVFAALLSTTIELVQVFSHMRFPSATDVVANVAGAALGARAFGALGVATPAPAADGR